MVGGAGYQRVLLTLDGSAASESALEDACQCVSDGGTLILYRVADLVFPHHLPPEANKHAIWEKQMEPARRYLDEVTRKITRVGIEVETQIGSGAIDEAIVDYAQLAKAQLIVMSTHARSGISHLLLGSIAEKVIRSSPVPVLVVRPTKPKE